MVTLHGKCVVFEPTGQMTFPELDRVYVPKVVEPRTWLDRENRLLSDARKYVLAWFGETD